MDWQRQLSVTEPATEFKNLTHGIMYKTEMESDVQALVEIKNRGLIKYRKLIKRMLRSRIIK